MLADLFYIAIFVAFFVISAAFARGLDNLSKEDQNG